MSKFNYRIECYYVVGRKTDNPIINFIQSSNLGIERNSNKILLTDN